MVESKHSTSLVHDHKLVPIMYVYYCMISLLLSSMTTPQVGMDFLVEAFGHGSSSAKQKGDYWKNRLYQYHCSY